MVHIIAIINDFIRYISTLAILAQHYISIMSDDRLCCAPYSPTYAWLFFCIVAKYIFTSHVFESPGFNRRHTMMVCSGGNKSFFLSWNIYIDSKIFFFLLATRLTGKRVSIVDGGVRSYRLRPILYDFRTINTIIIQIARVRVVMWLWLSAIMARKKCELVTE